jgi:hypothetical protein
MKLPFDRRGPYRHGIQLVRHAPNGIQLERTHEREQRAMATPTGPQRPPQNPVQSPPQSPQQPKPGRPGER